MIIGAGTCYFTINYVSGFPSLLPDEFTGGLNEEGNGCLIIRYGGWRIPLRVRRRVLRKGWRTFVSRARLASGATLLVAHSGGCSISILKFVWGMGSTGAWHLSAAPFDLDSRLLEEEYVPEGALTEIVRTSYYPQFISLFFARTSGVCVYGHTDHQSMIIPHNLVQHLRLIRRNMVNIRSGDRLFLNVEVEIGQFTGFRWSALVEACDFDIGCSIFFFLNAAEEFEMIVIGSGNLEVVYDWSRSYYRVI